MINRLRNRHFLFIDLLLIPLAVYLSFVLRLETWHPDAKLLQGLLVFLAITTVVMPVVFKNLGIYARYWLFASVDELLLLGNGVLLSTLTAYLLSLAVLYVQFPAAILPRSVPAIFLLLALLVTALPRLGLRLVQRQRRRWMRPTIGRRVLIAGAGHAGASVAQEMLENPQLGLIPVGFVDDDETKHHVRVHGLLVQGDRSAIPALVQEHKVQQVIIAMPTATGKEIREIVQICKQGPG